MNKLVEASFHVTPSFPETDNVLQLTWRTNEDHFVVDHYQLKRDVLLECSTNEFVEFMCAMENPLMLCGILLDHPEWWEKIK